MYHYMSLCSNMSVCFKINRLIPQSTIWDNKTMFLCNICEFWLQLWGWWLDFPPLPLQTISTGLLFELSLVASFLSDKLRLKICFISPDVESTLCQSSFCTFDTSVFTECLDLDKKRKYQRSNPNTIWGDLYLTQWKRKCIWHYWMTVFWLS